MDQDIERIKTIIDERNQRYAPKGGSVLFAGIQDETVKITPAGFCWR